MNCTGFQSKLHDYFFKSLAPEDVAAVDAHADGCAACGDLMRLAREISCREFVAFLNRYIEGELAPERRAVFERHLAICSDCTAYLDSYRKTMALSVQALRAEPAAAPAALPPALLRAILDACKG